jgi:hypothetical protein
MKGFINERIYNWTTINKTKKLGFWELERFEKWTEIKSDEFTNLQLKRI